MSVLACAVFFVVPLYLGSRQAGGDPGRPVLVSARPLDIAALPEGARLPALVSRPRPRAEPPNNTEARAETRRASVGARRTAEQPARAEPTPESAAEAPVLVPEGEQRP